MEDKLVLTSENMDQDKTIYRKLVEVISKIGLNDKSKKRKELNKSTPKIGLLCIERALTKKK